jgi:hypothetical protein
VAPPCCRVRGLFERAWAIRRPFWSDSLELRLLLVAQVCIKILKRIAHQFDGLQHCIQPPVHCGKASRRCDRIGPTFRVQHLDRAGTGVLQHFKGRALGVVQVQPGLDLVGRPF